MWSRKELKDRAKAVLRQIYWSAFGVSVVIAIAGGGNRWGSGGGGSRSNYSRNSSFSDIQSSNFDWTVISIILIAVMIAAAVILCLRIFIGYSLEVGGRKFFVQSAQYRNNKGCFSFGFDRQNYTGIIQTMFVKGLFTFLWTLLLIIPGIVKSYAYRMVPYILADNPNIGVSRAISLSNEMTRGHKFDMFVLDLSFIGWYLLGILALGVGVLFVMPYENATNAELYLVLRENAIRSSMCREDELLLNQPSYFNNSGMW